MRLTCPVNWCFTREKSLKTKEKQNSEIDKLQKLSKENNSLEYNDQKKLEDFVKNSRVLATEQRGKWFEV